MTKNNKQQQEQQTNETKQKRYILQIYTDIQKYQHVPFFLPL